ncbi:MAG TPA: FAD-dependent oxidoreductase [Daejeonella sp.]|nr:FAD-dependent oxidoreductase [Daejeonella sp.]
MNTGFSYWEQDSFLSGYDVLIIGSGIVGLNAALHLKSSQPALKVGVLEAGFLPAGASTKNAGFACFGSISELIDELKDSSLDELLQVVEMRWKGLEKLRQNLGDQAIDYLPLGGYEIFRKEDDELVNACLDKIDYFNQALKTIIQKPDIYAVANEKIAAFGFQNISCMIENRYEAQIDTGKMMQALLSKVQGLGISVFNHCHLNSIENDSEKLKLFTSQGVFICKKVILATNAFISDLYPELDVVPGRGQVLITKPIPDLKIQGTFHYDKGYYYFRNIHNRILLGGGRNLDFAAEETTLPGVTHQIQTKLEKLLSEVILPGYAPQIEQRWSGVMAFGNTLHPIIKELEPHVFCAVRCNGMGVAMGSLTGEKVADLMLQNL